MQSQPSILEVQCVGMNTPWRFQAPLNNVTMLPVMNAPAFNVAARPCQSRIMPQLLPSRSPANTYKPDLKVQARIQTQQIDSAIQLLKMQYDAIMASVHKSNLPQEQQLPPQPSTSAASTPVVDQKSFAAHFELPGPESEAQGTPARFMDATNTSKRKTHGDSDGISDSCSPSKSSECSRQSTKRLRRQ